MELNVAMKVFKKLDDQLSNVNDKYEISKKYYRNQNDITENNDGDSKADGLKQDKLTPLRNADSRISSNFHQLLVDQKASYCGAIPPTIDVEDDAINSKIKNVLGDKYQSTVQKLMVESSLAGVSWLHVWVDDNNEFRYGIVEPDQIIPIYSDSMEKKLLAVRRTYKKLDETDGNVYIYDEYWTDTEATFFKRKDGDDYSDLQANNIITTMDVNADIEIGKGNVLTHNMGDVPFIRFSNNADETGDLIQYKGQIDAYDIVLNGFINDVRDVQQVLLVLKNYGGADLNEFMENIRKYKSVKFQSDEGNSGLETVSVEIPVEARDKLLAKLNDQIYMFGQGLDLNKITLGTAVSGVAIKMMYSALEMKAAKLESEYRPSINRLIRFILRYLNEKDNIAISQTWKRSLISNELEQAQVISNLANVSSAEAIAKNSPIVSNWEEEIELRQEEKAGSDPYANDDELDKHD
ncbi:phage portal protein [Fructilactobacillus vespulae]|uniref:phage portal protein n=1 Tax=Fructilactobacillus vespulae TaxID=1249630 RepID=UPI0039B67416